MAIDLITPSANRFSQLLSEMTREATARALDRASLVFRDNRHRVIRMPEIYPADLSDRRIEPETFAAEYMNSPPSNDSVDAMSFAFSSLEREQRRREYSWNPPERDSDIRVRHNFAPVLSGPAFISLSRSFDIGFGDLLVRPPRVKEPPRQIDLAGLTLVLEASITQVHFAMWDWGLCLVGSFCRAYPNDQLKVLGGRPRLGINGPRGCDAVAIRFGITYVEASWLFLGLPAELFKGHCPHAALLTKADGIARLSKFIEHKRRSSQLALGA